MPTQVLRTSGEQFPGNSTAAEKVSVGLKRKGDACMQVCVVVSSSRSCILEIHRMTAVAQLFRRIRKIQSCYLP